MNRIEILPHTVHTVIFQFRCLIYKRNMKSIASVEMLIDNFSIQIFGMSFEEKEKNKINTQK